LDPATAVALAVCVLASVLFSITDSALTHFSRSGLEDLGRNDGELKRLQRLVERRHDYQLACFALNSIGNVLFVVLLTHSCLTPQATAAGFLAALGYSLLFILVVGEVIPRALGAGIADRWLYRTAPALGYVVIAAWPLTAVLGLINAVVGRLAGVPMERSGALELSEEIRSVVSEGEKNGALEEEEKEMIASIFDLHDVDVAEIMTPRTDMVCIEADAALAELRALATKCGFSRIPIFENTRDNIVGIVHVKDLLADEHPPELKARDVAQKPYFVPETKKGHELLQELRQQKTHIAVALDEYGGTAGLVTLEDIVEEIVGEIEDEYDEETAAPLRIVDDHTVECSGRLAIDDLNDQLNIKLPENESYDTVSGFVSDQLGHIPRKGETFNWGNVEFAVLDATVRKVRRLRVAIRRGKEAAEGG